MTDRLKPLFPALEPYDNGHLPLDPPHVMYYEQSGNPQGVPVLFLHGGPGGGSSPGCRRFFNPDDYRIILYDQRGSGNSQPPGCLENNTTQHLLADIERLRCHLGIEQWVVFGGSWGSTLALAYAETDPDACLGLVLRGIFLCQKQEIDWFLYGIRRFFPEFWDDFATYIPPHERDDLLRAYHRRLIDPDPDIHMPAARKWSLYEGSCSTLLPNPETIRSFSDDRVALGLARIEAHYFLNDIFLPENALLNKIDRIRHLPGIIIQGRYDMVCPPRAADMLAAAWPEADYILVPQAGHSALDPKIRSALVTAMEQSKNRFARQAA